MPRSGSGIYSKPAGTTAVAGTTIESAKYNQTIDDLVQDANTARPITAGGTGGTTKATAATGLEVLSYGSSQRLTAAQQVQARTNIGAALKGHIYGLTLSNNATDPINDIDIAPGEAASTETNPVLMTLATTLTKRLDGLWAAGSGNGGLDTGAIANTTYHVWLIQRSDTGVVDALFSTSASAPTMPLGYDRKRRIGSILRSSGSIAGFSQAGDRFVLNTRNLTFESNTSRAASPLTLFVPSGVPLIANISVSPISTSGNVLIISGDDFNFYSSATATYLNYEHGAATNNLAQINLGTTGTPNPSNNWQIYTRGWFDFTRSNP